MFSFGASRDAYSRVYCEGRVPHDRDIPGPGAYQIPCTTNEGKKIQMHKKIARESHVNVTSTTPGPGTYNNSLKNYHGNPVLSDHRNRGTPLLHLPIKQTASGRNLMKSGSKDNPGPGMYTPTNAVLNGQIKGSYSYICANERQLKIMDKTTKLLNPGPGSYIAPSDFGYPAGFLLRKSSSKKTLQFSEAKKTP